MHSVRSSLVSSLFLLSLAACGAPAATDPETPPAPNEKTVLTCTMKCPASCAAGTICVGASIYNSGYEPECLKTCKVSQDCAAGARCAALFGESAAGRVCVTSTTPSACRTPEARWHCDFPPARCESDVLLRPFSEPANYTCGPEYIRCDSGCVPATADTAAHCK